MTFICIEVEREANGQEENKLCGSSFRCDITCWKAVRASLLYHLQYFAPQISCSNDCCFIFDLQGLIYGSLGLSEVFIYLFFARQQLERFSPFLILENKKVLKNPSLLHLFDTKWIQYSINNKYCSKYPFIMTVFIEKKSSDLQHFGHEFGFEKNMSHQWLGNQWYHKIVTLFRKYIDYMRSIHIKRCCFG